MLKFQTVEKREHCMYEISIVLVLTYIFEVFLDMASMFRLSSLM